MTTYHKMLLGLIAAAYLISPVDIIPDFFIPYLGFFDDTAVIGAILYYIKNGRFPDFLYNKRKKTERRTENFQYTACKNQGKKYKPHQKEREQKSSYKKESDKVKEEPIQKKEESNKKSLKSPYEILGLLPGASKEDIQAAYRKSVKEYHPDKVAHLGKELHDFANNKFIEIKEAYNTLMKIT